MDLGITIHDPDVAFTDLGLAVLGAYFAARLTSRAGRTLMLGLASAALWGAVFHGLFPGGVTTTAGRIVWVAVVLSIVVVAATLAWLSLKTLVPGLAARIRWAAVGTYAVLFVAVTLLIDFTFGMVVRFYAPALGLFLLVATARALRTREAGWILMAAGLATSVAAALLQQLRVALHPVYFDHNALYHVVQAAALVLMYSAFRRMPNEDPMGTPARSRP